MYHKVSPGDIPEIGVLIRGRIGQVLMYFTNSEECLNGEQKWSRLHSLATQF